MPCKVFNILQCLQDLEGSGHPEYQQRTLDFCLRLSTEHLASEAQGLKLRQQAWSSLLRSFRSESALLSLFDSREVFFLIVLITPDHVHRERLIQALCGKVNWPKEEASRKEMEDRLAVQCLESFIHSLRGLAETPDNLTQRLMQHTSCAAAEESTESAMRALSESFSKLGIQASKRLLQGHGSRQFTVNVPAGSLQEKWNSELRILANAFKNDPELLSDRCILRCHEQLSANVLEDFLQRVELLPGGSFVVLGLNFLPLALQKRVQEAQGKMHSMQKGHARIFYVYIGAATPPQPDFISEMRLDQLDENVRASFPRQNDQVTVLCGLPGVGKTDVMRSMLGADVPFLSITAHWDEKRAQMTLNSLAAQGKGIGLKISEDADKLHVNRLLFDLLIIRSWRLETNGSVFAAGPGKSLMWCIEAPYIEQGEEELQEGPWTPLAAMHHFFPVLGVCNATVTLITDTSHELRIGADERFVAKYLQAGGSR